MGSSWSRPAVAESDEHDALVRVIACSLPACTTAELREIDECLVALMRERVRAAMPFGMSDEPLDDPWTFDPEKDIQAP